MKKVTENKKKVCYYDDGYKSVLEFEGEYLGYHILVVFRAGYRCGYVGLPKGFGEEAIRVLERSLANLKVYNGISYAKEDLEDWGKKKYSYYIGFDCFSVKENGGVDVDSAIRYDYGEKMMRWVYTLEKMGSNMFKDSAFVRSQCYSLVEQLEEIRKGEV